MGFPAAPAVWIPRFDASFIEPLVVTAQQLIIRDQAAALAWSSPDRALPPFKKVLLARRDPVFWDDRVATYPAVVVAPLQSTPPTSDDGGTIEETHRLAVELAISGSDPEQLTIDATRYVRAVDMIWRSASYADLTWNMKPGHFTAVETDVLVHDYPTIASDGPNAYLYTLGLTLSAQFREG